MKNTYQKTTFINMKKKNNRFAKINDFAHFGLILQKYIPTSLMSILKFNTKSCQCQWLMKTAKIAKTVHIARQIVIWNKIVLVYLFCIQPLTSKPKSNQSTPYRISSVAGLTFIFCTRRPCFFAA